MRILLIGTLVAPLTLAAPAFADEFTRPKGGDAAARTALADQLLGQGDPRLANEAVAHLRAAAEENYGLAEWRLGRLLAQGRHLPMNEAEAARLYLRAGEHGEPLGWVELACAYQAGLGVRRDQARAEALLAQAVHRWSEEAKSAGEDIYAYVHARLAKGQRCSKGMDAITRWEERWAEHGHAEAQFDLAQAYAWAERPDSFRPDLQQDKVLARSWLARAAERGHARAQLEYGRWLIQGIGGAANPDLGREMVAAAARQGLPEAAQALKE